MTMLTKAAAAGAVSVKNKNSSSSSSSNSAHFPLGSCRCLWIPTKYQQDEKEVENVVNIIVDDGAPTLLFHHHHHGHHHGRRRRRKIRARRREDVNELTSPPNSATTNIIEDASSLIMIVHHTTRDNDNNKAGSSNSSSSNSSEDVILCQWKPCYSSQYIDTDDNPSDNRNDNDDDSGSYFLAYHDSVKIVWIDPPLDDDDHNNNNNMKTKKQNQHDHCSDEQEVDEDNGDDILIETILNSCELSPAPVIWTLLRSAKFTIPFLSSSFFNDTTSKIQFEELGDPLFSSPSSPISSSSPLPFSAETTATLELLQRHSSVAIPFTPLSGIQMLHSLVLRIEEEAPSSSSPSHGHSSSSTHIMDPLLQACWKRQLSGKVVAYDANNNNNSNGCWTTSRIRLTIPDHQDTTATTMSAVVLVVESLTAMPSSHQNHHRNQNRARSYQQNTFGGSNNINKKSSSSLQFYMILPSTVITFRKSPTRRNGDSSSSHLPSSLSSTVAPKLTPTPTPPSAAASLLLETMQCVANGRCGVPRTFLLSGPPGVGKTFSVQWAWTQAQRRLPRFVDNQGDSCKVVLSSLRGSELLQQQMGVTTNPAQALKREFQRTVMKMKMMTVKSRESPGSTASSSSPPLYPVGLIFLDECDALVGVESVAAMLAALLDQVGGASTDNEGRNNVEDDEDESVFWHRLLVVGATNLVDSIPSSLRRAGRFDCEVPMSPPSAKDRAALISSLLLGLESKDQTSTYNSSPENDSPLTVRPDEIQTLAEACVGYVPADLTALVRKAWLVSLQDNCNRITYMHLESARREVAPSALRDALLAAPPKMTWDDVAGDPGGAKTALRQAVEWPRLRAREYAVLGLQPPRGILLHGPPGCAKTTLARAAAGASGVAFLSLSPAQVYASSFVGEAEGIVRRAFALARSAAPCILFFDEVDSLFGGGNDNNDNSGMGGGGRGGSAEARVLSTFLNEMDGVDIASKDGVLVLGATNRPWTLDGALLRPGRLGDKIIFLPPPDEEARRAILEVQFRSLIGEEEMGNWDWNMLTELTQRMTGAEVVGACIQAKLEWWKHVEATDPASFKLPLSKISLFHLDYLKAALDSVKPLLSDPQALEEFQFTSY